MPKSCAPKDRMKTTERNTSAAKQQTGGHPHVMAGRRTGSEYVTSHHRGSRRKG